MSQDLTSNPWLDDVLGSFEMKLESNENIEMTDDVELSSNLQIKKHKRKIKIEDSKPTIESLEANLSTATLQSAASKNNALCRLCGIKLQKEERMQNENDVFSANYPKKILKCTSLKVEQGDGLPRKMCIECITNLNRSYDFRTICIHTYKFLKRSTFSQSLDSNSADGIIHSTGQLQTEPYNTDIGNEVQQREIKTRMHLNAKRKKRPPNILTKKEKGSILCLSQSNVPVDEDTVDQYCDENMETFFDQDTIEDDGDTRNSIESQTEGNIDYGSCDVIIKTELEEDMTFSNYAEYLDYQNGSEVDFDDMESGKKIFDASYPSSKEKYVQKAKKDIAKYFMKGGTDVLCPFCPASFNIELYNELNQHLDSHILTKHIFVCRYEDCNETFKLATARKVHEGTDHGTQQLTGRILFCDHCADMVKPATYCKSHRWKKERSDTIFQCDRCPFRSRDKLRLSHHIKGLHESQQVKCKLCNTMLPINKLRYHMNNEHRAKIPCGYCNKEFLPRNIKGHLRTHTGEKPFSCADCGLEFTFRVSLKTHRKRYHGDDMFEVKTEV